MKSSMFAVLGAVLLALLLGGCAATTMQRTQETVPAAESASIAKDSSVQDSSETTSLKRKKDDLIAVIDDGAKNRIRPIYNTYLRRRPHFKGQIVVKMVILGDGSVESTELLSSTTGYDEFDQAALAEIARWNFGAGNYGVTKVTIPFTVFE